MPKDTTFRQTTVCSLYAKENHLGQPYYTGRCGHLQVLVVPVKNPALNEAPYALLFSETSVTQPAKGWRSTRESAR